MNIFGSDPPSATEVSSLRDVGKNIKGRSAVTPSTVGTNARSGKLCVLAQCIPEENVTKADSWGTYAPSGKTCHFSKNSYFTATALGVRHLGWPFRPDFFWKTSTLIAHKTGQNSFSPRLFRVLWDSNKRHTSITFIRSTHDRIQPSRHIFLDQDIINR